MSDMKGLSTAILVSVLVAAGALSSSCLGAPAGEGAAQASPSPTPFVPWRPPIEIISFGWTSDSGTATAVGEISNASGEPLNQIKARVSFMTPNGTEIGSAEGLLASQSLAPGQTSTFTAQAPFDSAMTRAHVKFMTLSGEEVAAAMR